MELFVKIFEEAREARALYGSAPTELPKHFDGRLHLMSTRYSRHPVWVGSIKQFALEVKASDIATMREFAGLPP
jgi:hypothetical protein